MDPITAEIHVAAALVAAVAGPADGSPGARRGMAVSHITRTSNATTKCASTTAQPKCHIGTTNPDYGCEWHHAAAGIPTPRCGTRERLDMAAIATAAAAAGRAMDAASAKRILDVLGWYQVRSTKQGPELASFGVRVQGLEQAASTQPRAIIRGAIFLSFSSSFSPCPLFSFLLLSPLALSLSSLSITTMNACTIEGLLLVFFSLGAAGG